VAFSLNQSLLNQMRAMLAFEILAAGQTSPSVATEAFDRLAAKVPLELVWPAAASDLAGHYTGQTSELEARVGPFLGGEDRYLFPDGSYVYCEWTDLMPGSVFDKGKWSVVGNLLKLVSDTDVRWDPDSHLDRLHLRYSQLVT